MMNFEHKSYSGKLFRPRPEIHYAEDKQLILIVTPWGDRAVARKAIDLFNEFFYQSSLDDELTMPFSETNTFSHQTEDRIYNALQICHKHIREQVNNNEYLTGIEMTAFHIDNNQASWAQIGHPNIFLLRDTMSILPLSYQYDLSLESCVDNKITAPLPQKFLGFGGSSHIYSNSFKLKKTDQIIFTSLNYLPKKFYQIDKKQTSLDGISQIFSDFSSDNPFWLGLLNL